MAHAAGSDADRVLLLGNGIAVGYGVLSHDLGLAGNLARRLTALTGRGTTVDVRAFPDITPADAIDILSQPVTRRYDAIVATLGGMEAVTLTSASSWRAALTRMIEMAQSTAPNADLYFVGVPLTSMMVHMPRIYGMPIEAHTRHLNAITREVCDRYSQATFIPFEPSPSRIVDDIGRQWYQAWAELIADPIADGLDNQVHIDRIATDEDARQLAVDRMHLDGAEQIDELEQIVATARDLFGASGAGVNIIDRARQWVLAAAGMSREDTPRVESICTTTIGSADMLIVEDTHSDDLYRTMHWAHGDDPIRFYAGYPIEAPDGHRIGALCVVDSKPRTFSATDKALLRELAMRTQTLLWEKYRALSRPS